MKNPVKVINGVDNAYEVLAKMEIKYISLQDLPNFQKWKVYKGKRDGDVFLMRWDGCNYVLFYDKEIHEYFITERQYKLKGNYIYI